MGGIAAPATRSNSSSPAPARCRSARRTSPIRSSGRSAAHRDYLQRHVERVADLVGTVDTRTKDREWISSWGRARRRHRRGRALADRQRRSAASRSAAATTSEGPSFVELARGRPGVRLVSRHPEHGGGRWRPRGQRLMVNVRVRRRRHDARARAAATRSPGRGVRPLSRITVSPARWRPSTSSGSTRPASRGSGGPAEASVRRCGRVAAGDRSSGAAAARSRSYARHSRRRRPARRPEPDNERRRSAGRRRQLPRRRPPDHRGARSARPPRHRGRLAPHRGLIADAHSRPAVPLR